MIVIILLCIIIITQLISIFKTKTQKMAVLKDFTDQITAAETALTTISTEITTLQAQIQGSLSEADANTALQALTDLTNKLSAIANPTPPVAS